MRTQSDPEALENKARTREAVSRDPSYPDRQRIDSDVRAFLRPVSTPWIVFDRDSRVDDFAKSALRVGAVFASSPSFRPEVLKAAAESGRSLEEVVAAPLPGLAPPPAYREKEPTFFPVSESRDEPAQEPSNMVVSSDLRSETPPEAAVVVETVEAIKVPRRKRGRIAAIAGASIVALAALGTLLVFSKRSRPAIAAPQAAQVAQASLQVAALEEPAPIETVELDSLLPSTAGEKRGNEAKRGLGKLTIRGEAKHKNVYFDGKRMLGQGSRSFTVFCGMHTVAVTDKTEAKDIEVPCSGEYVVSR